MTEEEWEDKLAEVQRHSENWYEKYRSVQDLLAIEMTRNIKYEKQIEKMKCCSNCMWSECDGKLGNPPCKYCGFNNNKWELRK